jgi:hypothetical protein
MTGEDCWRPKPVPWPDEWGVMVEDIRAAGVGLFWELFSGSGELTKSFCEAGWTCGPPLDAALCSSFNLLNPLFLSVCVGVILEGRILLVSLDPPRGPQPLASAICDASTAIAKAAVRSGNHAIRFSPTAVNSGSLLGLSPTLPYSAQLDTCRFGTPWLRRVTACSSFVGVETLACSCRHDHAHSEPKLSYLTHCFWPGLADAVSGLFAPLFGMDAKSKAAHLAGWTAASSEGSVLSTLDAIGFRPSGRRARSTVAATVSACRQPAKRLAPTLIPEGIGPVAHLSVALSTQHPFLRRAEMDRHIESALVAQHDSSGDLISHRSMVCDILDDLKTSVVMEWETWLPFVHEDIREIVGRRLVPFCREISFVVQWCDPPLWSDFVQGLPMAGWACPSLALPAKLTIPIAGGESVDAVADGHNRRIFNSVRSSGDPKLDEASWSKSAAEFSLKTLLGPFDLAELPHNVRLLPRRPIWECHGGKVEPSCRNIDDCLVGEQNASVGLVSVHRPCTIDTLVAGGRRVAERFPLEKLSGFTSDFGGAYRQVPASARQKHLFGVTLWNPIEAKTVVGLAVAQLFGSRSSPLNFSRFPDWCSFVCSRLFLLGLWQCIDDLIAIERQVTAPSGREAWLVLAACCGWDVPLKKSPVPLQCFRALGIFLNLKPLPAAHATIVVCERRIEGLIDTLRGIGESQSLTSGAASSLVGKLMFATVAFAGQYGRAMLKAFRRRCYERRSNLNPQLLASVDWWIRSLGIAPSRPIPWSLDSRHTVVTYSDGEGSGGIGVAIWSSKLSSPEAGRMMVPADVRKLWSSSLSSSPELYDIQEVEAVGPLVALSTWPHVLRNSVWMHYIDNNGALSSLVKGGSSVLGTDTIVGYTWHLAAKCDALPWFDRVDTKSNPVDGLSRGDVEGPWSLVKLVFPGASLSQQLRRSRRFTPS